jgi:hypothetical protein
MDFVLQGCFHRNVRTYVLSATLRRYNSVIASVHLRNYQAHYPECCPKA